MYALNARRTTESPFSPLAADSPADLLSSTMSNLLESARTLPHPQQPKIVVNSTAGVGSSWGSMMLPIRWLFGHSTMKVAIDDHNKVDDMVRRSGLVFVMARAARLTEGRKKATGAGSSSIKVFGENGKGAGWFSSISRERLASWLIDAAEKSDWDGTAPVVTE